MRRMHAVGLALLTLGLLPHALAAQEQSWIADITAAPQRFWNRTVTLEGQVTQVQSDPAGTERGYYRLIDDSDPNGIVVRSKDLPAPGKLYRVSGQITQNPKNAAEPILQEVDRAVAGRPGWLLPVILVSGFLALVLLVALGVLLVRGNRSVPGKGSETVAWAGVGGSLEAGNGQRVRDTASESTVRYRPLDESEKTQVFRSLGATLKVVEGPDAGKEFPVGTSPLFLGRRGGRQNHVTLSDTTVSREHAKIVYNEESGRFTVVNESATNKVEVNREPVDAAELKPGARIRVGATVLEFESEKGAPV